MKQIVAAAILILFSACSADEGDILKQPSNLEFKMDVKREPTKEGKLVFEGGYLMLSRFTFDGSRVQGSDTYFERRYEEGLMVPFDPGQLIPQLSFEVPQGTYTEIEIEFEIESDDEVSLQVSGRYTDADGTTFPLVLQLEELEIFGVYARNEDGGNEVIIVSENSNLGNIVLNPVHWFATVDTEDLDDAQRVTFEGEETILINEEVNETIYEMVEDRVDELMELVIL